MADNIGNGEFNISVVIIIKFYRRRKLFIFKPCYRFCKKLFTAFKVIGCNSVEFYRFGCAVLFREQGIGGILTAFKTITVHIRAYKFCQRCAHFIGEVLGNCKYPANILKTDSFKSKTFRFIGICGIYQCHINIFVFYKAKRGFVIDAGKKNRGVRRFETTLVFIAFIKSYPKGIFIPFFK